MVIFKRELKQIKKLTIVWSLILSILIILALPVYIDMASAGSIPIDRNTDNPFFESVKNLCLSEIIRSFLARIKIIIKPERSILYGNITKGSFTEYD